MELMLKNTPVLEIYDNGMCKIIDFGHLPFALRRKGITFVEFMEWAANRALSIGRSYAKEILNILRLPQMSRYAVCKACRGLSLEDSYWIRQKEDAVTWEEVNLFQNPLSLFVTEVSLSGSCRNHVIPPEKSAVIHTPELTTLGVSAKGWIRQEDGLYLHKVGKYEVPASQILDRIGIRHIPYHLSEERDVGSYLSDERREWIAGAGEAIVNSRLFTAEDIALVTFEEFRIFCEAYGLNPWEEAVKIGPDAYLDMQIADYLLNNNDRHEQNWGFLMDNASGKLTGYCPLFDHDHAFSGMDTVWSQTAEGRMTLREAAKMAQKARRLDLSGLYAMEPPRFLDEERWEQVKDRGRQLL